MLAVRASFAILVSAAVLLTGCTVPGVSADSSGQSADPSVEPTSTAAITVDSAQPEPLIDLDCSDFAEVANMGTIAGVTERDPRGAVNDSLDVVPLADIVRNAGGVACEFSDGGAWRKWHGDVFGLNDAWHGAAIFVVPNAADLAGDFEFRSECSGAATSTHNMCSSYFASGGAVVNLVISWSDRAATFTAVRDYVLEVVAGATSTPGPVARPAGTFDPPHECASLIPTATMSTILGAPGGAGERAMELEFAAEATYLTENTGCEWWVDGEPLVVEVLVYPGGGWMAEGALPALHGTPLALAGAHDNDTAVQHCDEVTEWGFWLCTVEVVADGTWIHATGNAESEAAATAAAIAAAEATLANRD